MCRRFVGRGQCPLPQELEHVKHHQHRIRVFDDESGLESESNLVAKETRVVVANIDQFGPVLESPAANEIAGFMFSEMHVKEQGLVK